MNLRDLKYLVAVAELNHFGKAAEACFVSQPALSMQIKKLEDSLGVQLIERTNKRVIFTKIGKLIVQQAREIIFRVKALEELANQHKDPFCGEIHLGIIPTLAPYLLPLITPELSKLFPTLKLYWVEDKTLNLLKKLNDGKLDGALLALPIEGGFESYPLFDEEFFLALPGKNSLAKQKNASFSDLENNTLLLLEDGHCLREQALAVCNRANAAEAKNFRATSLETLRHMVASGIGMTLMPKLACQSNDGVNYLPFNSPAPMRTIGLICRESSAKKVLLGHLVDQIRANVMFKN